jgi:hypothetical protein
VSAGDLAVAVAGSPHAHTHAHTHAEADDDLREEPNAAAVVAAEESGSRKVTGRRFFSSFAFNKKSNTGEDGTGEDAEVSKSKTAALYEKYLNMAHGNTFEDIRNLQMIYRCGTSPVSCLPSPGTS